MKVAAAQQKHSEIKKQMSDGIIAFSFGLGPDGSPGRSNEQLANVLFQHLAADRTHLVVQWEIADAMHHLHAYPLQHRQIAYEPTIDLNTIAQPVEVARRIARASAGRADECAAFIFAELDVETRRQLLRFRTQSPDALSAALASGFNQLLSKRGLSDRFLSRIPSSERPQVTQLEKPGKGHEVRALPEPAGRVLGRGQLRRINRLVLEAIFGDTLNTRKHYLSTTSVCRQALKMHPQVAVWRVFAHPHHQARCEETLLRVAAEMDIAAAATYADCDDVEYDPASAQSWTRSEAAYRRYEEALSTL